MSPAVAAEPLYSPRIAVRAARVSRRQLNWWRQKGFLHAVLRPLEHGVGYHYSLADLLLLTLILKLPHENGRRRSPAAIDYVCRMEAPYLVVETEWRGVAGMHWASTPAEVIAAGVAAPCGVQLIDIEGMRRELARRASS